MLKKLCFLLKVSQIFGRFATPDEVADAHVFGQLVVPKLNLKVASVAKYVADFKHIYNAIKFFDANPQLSRE